MPLRTVTTAGTAVQLTTGSASPSANFAARLTLQWIPTNTGKVYVGIGQNPLNTGSSVSSSAYDVFLDSTNTSVTLGLGNGKRCPVKLDTVWLDAETNGNKVAWFVEEE